MLGVSQASRGKIMFLLKVILQIGEFFFFPFEGIFTFYNIQCDIDIFNCYSFARQLRLDE